MARSGDGFRAQERQEPVSEFWVKENRFPVGTAGRYKAEFLAGVVEVGKASEFAAWKVQHGEPFNVVTRVKGLLRIEDLGGVEFADRPQKAVPTKITTQAKVNVVCVGEVCSRACACGVCGGGFCWSLCSRRVRMRATCTNWRRCDRDASARRI
jgi:hypothetical protein